VRKFAVVAGDSLSSGQLARLLNVSPKTIARWATDDELPSFRTGTIVTGSRTFGIGTPTAQPDAGSGLE
jgi:hypothetical protein